MFYILATRLPLVYTDLTKRKYLKLFILGSIIYLCVHYYLFLEERTGLLNKVKSKLYYIMIADFAIASLLTRFLTHKNIEEDDEKEDKEETKQEQRENNNIVNNQMLQELERRRLIELEEQKRKMIELFRQQQMKQEQEREQEREETKKKSKNKEETTSSSSSSESSSKKNSKDKKEVKGNIEKKVTDTDTELPVYE